jgi:hypothetical protein
MFLFQKMFYKACKKSCCSLQGGRTNSMELRRAGGNGNQGHPADSGLQKSNCLGAVSQLETVYCRWFQANSCVFVAYQFTRGKGNRLLFQPFAMGAGASLKRDVAEAGATLSVHYVEPPTNPSFVQRLLGRVNDAKRITFHLASSIDEGVHNGFVGLQGRMLTNRNWFAESVKAHRGVRLGPDDAACWQVLFALYSEFTIQARGYARILMMQLAAGAKLPRLFKVKESHAVFGPSYHVQNMELFVAEACSNQGAFMRKYIRNMRHLASVLCNEIFVPPIILVDVNGYRVLCRALPPTLPRRLPSIYLSEYGVAGKTEHDFVRAGVMLQRIGLLRHITKGWDVSVYAHSFLMFSMEDREFNTALLCDDIGSLFCIPLRPELPEGSVPLLQPQTDPLLLDLEEWQWRPELFNYYGDILGSTSADDKLRLLPVCAFVTKIVLPDAMSALAQDESSIFIPLSASSHDVLEKRSLISTELQRHCLNCRLLGITLVYVATTGIGATFKNIIVHEMVARTMRSHWRQYLASDAKQGGRSGGLDIQLSIFLQRIFRNHGNYVSKFLIPSVFEKYATTAIQWVKIANTTRLNVVQAVSSHEDWCSSLHDHKISIIFMQAGISPTVHIDQPNVTLQDLFGVEDVILRFLNLIGASIQNVEALDVFLKLGKFNSSTPTHVPVNISETQHKSLSFEILARIEVDRLTASSIAIFGARYRLNEVLRQLELSSCIIPYPWFGKTLLARTYVEMGQSVGGDMKTASIIAAAINLSQALACNPYQNFLLTALSNFVVNGALEKSNMATKGRPQTHEAKIRLSSSRVLAHNKKVTTPSKASTWEWRYASRDELHEWTLDHLFVLAHTIKDANGFEQPNAWLTHVVGLAVDIVSQACKERISPFCQRGAFDIAGQIFRRVHATMIKWNETTQNFPVLEFMQHLFDEAQSVTPQVLGDPQALQIPRMFENDRQLGILIGYCLIQDREEYSKFRISPRTEFVIHGAIGRCASAPCLETILKLRETSCPEVSLGLDTVSILLTEHANDRLLKLLRKRMQMSRTLVIGSAPHITNQGLSGLLIRSNNLKSISFENCNVANDSLLFKIAPILTAITSLSITSNDAVTDAGARCIQQMTNLMTLDLHGCYQITDSSMTEVVLHCPSLISLNLSGCPCISDMTLLSLAMRCYAVQAPQTFSTQKEPTDLMDDRVQTLYNSDSIGPHEIWPEATSVLQTNNRVVQFDFSGFPDSTKASNPSTISSAKTGTDSFQINPDAEEEDDEGIKMSSKYGGVIKEYIAESTFEPLQLHELPMTDRSDVTILICVHNVFLMEKLFNEVSTLTVTDLYVAATHNNSMGRTEAGKISDQMKFRKHIEIGDIDEVSKRITVSLSAKTSVGASLVYGEVGVSLPKLIDVPGDRFRIKIPLNDGFNAKLLKSKKKKPVIEDQSQEEAYKKGKLTGKKQDMAEQTSVPTIAVIELTIELASPVSIFYCLIIAAHIELIFSPDCYQASR